MRLDDLNRLEGDAAAREFLRCCGSRRWAASMAAARPFTGVEQLGETADAVWRRLEPPDWLEAFAAHPRIGASVAGGSWAGQEQRGAATASGTVRDRLAAGNRDYEARFGYIFIVCASGKTAGEMLKILGERLTHDPAAELRVAAEEQRQITRLRLRKLVGEP